MSDFNAKGQPMCQVGGCKKRAKYNLQSGTMLWTITPQGRYRATTSDFSVDDSTNDHFCEEHAEEEGII